MHPLQKLKKWMYRSMLSGFVQVLALTEGKFGIIISFFPVARKVLSPDAQNPELQDGA